MGAPDLLGRFPLVDLRVQDDSDLHLALERECLGRWIEALTAARDRLEVAVRVADAREVEADRQAG